MTALIEVITATKAKRIIGVEIYGGDDELFEVIDKLKNSYHWARLIWAGEAFQTYTASEVLRGLLG